MSLSFLQETILGLALEDGGHALLADIAEFWWRVRGGSGSFSRADVGEKEYNRIYVSVSRSIERLRLKNLIRVFKEITGNMTLILLTDSGLKMAKPLNPDE